MYYMIKLQKSLVSPKQKTAAKLRTVINFIFYANVKKIKRLLRKKHKSIDYKINH